MPHIRPKPSLLPIEQPDCPKWQGHMMLAGIETAAAHSDLRTFQCTKCNHVHKMLVEEDPMHSANAGWQNSGLRAPT
jgi:hypothetical protein